MRIKDVSKVKPKSAPTPLIRLSNPTLIPLMRIKGGQCQIFVCSAWVSTWSSQWQPGKAMGQLTALTHSCFSGKARWEFTLAEDFTTKPVTNKLIRWTIYSSSCKSFQRIVLSKLLNAFLVHEVQVQETLAVNTTIILSVAMWSVQDLSFLNPACSFLSCLSRTSLILCNMIRQRTLLGIDNSVISFLILHSLRLPFVWRLTTVEPVYNGAVLSGHPLLSDQFKKSRFFAHTNVKFVTLLGGHL